MLHQYFIGTIFIALGLAVSGYMLKYYAAFSNRGAAGNKIAINLGSILSGVAILLTNNKVFLIGACIVFLFCSFCAFAHYFKSAKIKFHQNSARHFDIRNILTIRGFAWAITGYIIGVKIISIVSILPQFLIQSNNGHLPNWYGWMIILNCSLVVIFQIPVMCIISKWSKQVAILPLALGMLIIGLSSWMELTNFFGAFFWTLALSFVECTTSYLDKLSQDEHSLLLKEAAVGIGVL